MLLLSPLVGYSFVQALTLYGEASRSVAGLPEVARNLSPLDGILVPTFGGLYLTATFLFRSSPSARSAARSRRAA